MKQTKLFSILAGMALVILFLGLSLFVVDETEQAVVTQFGKPVKVILNPVDDIDMQATLDQLKASYTEEGIAVSQNAGLHFKIPFLQNVTRFDRRLLRWNGLPEEIPTKDKKYIWVDCTARWTIQDPLKFMRSVGTEEQALSRLDDIIDSSTKNSITKRDLIEIVRTDNRPMQVAEEELRETIKIGQVLEGRPDIVAEITAESRKACADYGIDIHSSGVLLKGLTYVQEVKEKVELRMIEERQRIAKKYISEGDGEYQRVMGDREREVKTILSEAYKQAQQIEGEADATATQIYADAFGKDPGFYQFWRTLRLYEENLANQQTHLILGTDNPLFELIKGQQLE